MGGSVLVWILARSVSRARLGRKNRDLPVSALYSREMRQALLEAGVAEALRHEEDPKVWLDEFAIFNGKILGMALVEADFVPAVETVLTLPQRIVQDYWRFVLSEVWAIGKFRP